MRKIVTLFMIGFICLTGLWIATGDVSADVETQDSIYTIYINSNADFVSQAATENWTGDGTKGNPYIIEDYDINASSAHGIGIRNTDVYFIIKNCTIHGNNSHHGIYFYNVTNGTIDNVTSENNYYGIYLHHSSGNIVKNCVCSNNNEGIHLFSSLDNEILNSYVFNNHVGIHLSSSDNNKITDCVFDKNDYYGVILSSSENNNITRCVCLKNNYASIYLTYSSDNIISDCTCLSSVTGIKIISSSNNNHIYNNTLDNAKNAWDECNNSWNSSSKGNCWSDYNGTGEYSIPGGDNKDFFPSLFKPESGKEEATGAVESEKISIIYPVIICIAIILVSIMLYGVIETKTILIRCPACSKTFRVKKKPRPFKTECKYCNRKGMLK